MTPEKTAGVRVLRLILPVCPPATPASEETETLSPTLFPKRMKKHFGFFQGPGTLCQTATGVWCGLGGDFFFLEDGTQMWPHIRKLQLLECLPSSPSSLPFCHPPRPPPRLFPFSLAAWEELLSGQKTFEEDPWSLDLMSIPFSPPCPSPQFGILGKV